MATQIPEWVGPNNLLFCGQALFVPSSARTPKPGTSKAPLVLAGNGQAFKLKDVRLARSTDIYHARIYIDSSGLTIELQPQNNSQVILSHPDSQAQAAVSLPQDDIEFDLAVSSFCKAFNGRIAEDYSVDK